MLEARYTEKRDPIDFTRFSLTREARGMLCPCDKTDIRRVAESLWAPIRRCGIKDTGRRRIGIMVTERCLFSRLLLHYFIQLVSSNLTLSRRQQ